MTAEFDEQQVAFQVTERLQERFPDIAPAEVEEAVRSAIAELHGRPVQDYIAVLAERTAKKQLAKRSTAKKPKKSKDA